MAITGFTDIPSKDDYFDISNYINGLVEFIEKCETPLTIAIQGDWGTGKSSIMEMLLDKLKKEDGNNHVVFFNTWQFSQFNLKEQLPIIMLSRLMQIVSGEKKDNIDIAKKIANALFKISSATVKSLTKGIVDMKDIVNGASENTMDIIEQIQSLKDNFQTLIDQRAGDDGRVIIFIDDLDRLQPERAVELLEVLKIFLDCKKCVFVLAIDYGVVTLGVKAKYGDDFDEDKAKSFFDKIIQVPFKMPVYKYKIDSFIKQHFKKMGISFALKNDEDINVYKKFIAHSIGNNPRGMKRLFNSFQLLDFITFHNSKSEEKEKDKSKEIKILFAILCMQSSFEKTYNYILENVKIINASLFSDLRDEQYKLYSDLKFDKDEIKRTTLFFKDFYQVIDEDGNGELDDIELNNLKKILDFSSITSSSKNSVNPEIDELFSSIDELFK